MREPQATTRRHAMRSIREAARDTGVPEVTLRRWIAEGELFAVRLGPSALVDLGEVAAVRDRLAADMPPRRQAAWPSGVVRAIGVGDLAAGLVGLVLVFGLGPDELRSPWSLGATVLCFAVGVTLLWPDLIRRGRLRA